jgi:sugar phosphate isomerase/epimerase
MKYSSCITNSPLFSQNFEEIIEKFVNFGFDGIDIPGDQINYPIQRIKPILESYSDKIQVAELTACMNPTLDLIHPDPSKRKKAVDYIKYCIETASELGNNLTHMCFLSFQENFDKNSRETLEKLAVNSIAECSKHAENLGVTLLIEPLFKGDVSLINRCDQAIDLLARAINMDPSEILRGGTKFGLLQDIFHMHHEEKDLLSTVEKYSNITYHVHVADHPRGLDFTRADSAFVAQTIKKLKSLKYAHYISFETFDDAWTLDKYEMALKNLRTFEIN